MNFRKQAKRGLLLGLICGLGLVSVLAGRMVLDSSRQLEVGAADIPELRDGHVDRLSQAVKIQTISSTKWEDFNQEAFGTFHTWLQSSFPKVATNLKRQPIEPCSVTYTWQGSQPDLEPALLISHLDVVPVEPQAASQWTHPPFSGAIGQGYIWGRGTLDDKLGVVGILEAAETLLEAGFTPARTHVFAFGCDEEVGGNLGARHIAEAFQKENKQFAYVLDEGHIIGKGLFPGRMPPSRLWDSPRKVF